MGGYKRYTDKERADCVVFLESLGWPDQMGASDKASKHLGVARTTLEGWARAKHNPVPDDVLAESRIELGEALDREVDRIFKQMDAVRPDASYRDLAVAAGIFIDKKQLISGQPTGNVKQTISFERTGITTLPEHLTPGTIEGVSGEETV